MKSIHDNSGSLERHDSQAVFAEILIISLYAIDAKAAGYR